MKIKARFAVPMLLIIVSLAVTLRVRFAHGSSDPLYSFTPGSVLFGGADGLISENNSDLFWNNAETKLQVGNSNGFLSVGGGSLQILQTSTNNVVPQIVVTGRNGLGRIILTRYNGSETAITPILAEDVLGRFGARGYISDTSALLGAQIEMRATENWTPTTNGSLIAFQTTKNGTSGLTNIYEAALITDFGAFQLGNTGTHPGHGIGSTVQSRLLVSGMGTSSSTWIAQFHDSSGTSNSLMIRDDGKIGIGTAAPQTALTFPVASTGISLYNTADMATNYEQGLLSWSSNVFKLASSRGGAGVARDINISTPTSTFILKGVAGSGPAIDYDVAASSAPNFTAVRLTNSTMSVATSGTYKNVLLSPGITPSGAGSGNYHILDLSYTLNGMHGAQTGTATGIFLNATENTLNGMGHNLMDLQVGSSSKFLVTNSGNVGVGISAPSQKLEINGGLKLNTTNAKPDCNSLTRGTFWYTQGSTGVKDTVEVCAKDATDVYAWQTLL